MTEFSDLKSPRSVALRLLERRGVIREDDISCRLCNSWGLLDSVSYRLFVPVRQRRFPSRAPHTLRPHCAYELNHAGLLELVREENDLVVESAERWRTDVPTDVDYLPGEFLFLGRCEWSRTAGHRHWYLSRSSSHLIDRLSESSLAQAIVLLPGAPTPSTSLDSLLEERHIMIIDLMACAKKGTFEVNRDSIVDRRPAEGAESASRDATAAVPRSRLTASQILVLLRKCNGKEHKILNILKEGGYVGRKSLDRLPRMTQETIARRIRGQFDGNLKATLSSLAKRGLLDNGKRHGTKGGYFLPSEVAPHCHSSSPQAVTTNSQYHAGQ